MAGPEDSDRPVRFIPMTNAERSPTFYIFDSAELLALYQDMDAPRRGAGDRLPLPHRDRGLPVAHRHQLRLRAERALRAGVHPRPGRRTSSAPTASSTASSPKSRSRSSRRSAEAAMADRRSAPLHRAARRPRSASSGCCSATASSKSSTTVADHTRSRDDFSRARRYSPANALAAAPTTAVTKPKPTFRSPRHHGHRREDPHHPAHLHRR